MALLLIGFAPLAAHIYVSVKGELTEAATARRVALAQLASATLSERLDRMVDVAVSLATRVRFAELVSSGRWDAAAQILRGVPAEFRFVDRVVLYDPQGTLMADVPRLTGVQGRNFAHRDWYQGVTRGWKPYVSEVYRRAAMPQRDVFAVAVPIVDRSGAPAGILQLQIHLETFFDWAKAIDLGPGGAIYVVDRKGTAAFGSAASKHARLASLAANPAVAHLLKGRSGIEVAEDPAAGGEHLYAYVPGRHGWGVVAAQPAIEAFAARESQLWGLLAGYAMVLAFCAAIAGLILHLLSLNRRLEDLYNNAPCGYHSVDESGLIIRMNDTWLGWLGYAREEVVGRLRHADLMTPASAQRFWSEAFPLFKKQGWLKEVEFEYVRKDGSTFPGSLQTSTVYDRRGRYLMSRTTVFDISARRRMEDELKQSNAFLDSLVENIPNMIFVKDAGDLRFVRFNRAGEALLGYPRGDLIGKNDYDFFPRAEADLFTARDREVLAGSRVVDIAEEPVHTRDRGVRTLHTKKIPVLDHAGRPRYLLGISEDITERKAAEERIHVLNEQLQAHAGRLEAANKELESFSYSVSHDLRAPLRAVDGYTRMLEEDYGGRLDEEGRRLLGVVRSSTRQMGQLIDDLLAFSRLGRQELNKGQVDMGRLAGEVTGELARLASAAVVEVSALPPAYADRALLRQVWTNLVGNALKYSGKRERQRIEIGGRRDAAENVYWVRDNGAGFDMRYAHKLFGVFQRLHRADEFPGTGVGLAIVQRIVTRHGGRVWAEAKPDEGACFHFSLPAEA